MVILPGYCVVGTVGHKLLKHGDVSNRIEVEKGMFLEVNCKVKYLSFSAHADAKGILQLVRQVEPRNVMLVHGEGQKMSKLQTRIEEECGVPCIFPPNGTTVHVPSSKAIPIATSASFLRAAQSQGRSMESSSSNASSSSSSSASSGSQLIRPVMSGVLVHQKGQEDSSCVVRSKLMSCGEAAQLLGAQEHTLLISCRQDVLPLCMSIFRPTEWGTDQVEFLMRAEKDESSVNDDVMKCNDWLNAIAIVKETSSIGFRICVDGGKVQEMMRTAVEEGVDMWEGKGKKERFLSRECTVANGN